MAIAEKVSKDPFIKSKIAQRQVGIAFKIILFLSGTKTTVKGIENVPTDEPVLYVANHRGFYDIVIAYANVPTQTCFVSKKELENVPLISWWMRRLGCLFLDRDDIKAGLKTILEGIEKVKDGYSIFIMPEGTRNNTDEVLPFHEGSFKFAQKTNCPIIPVAITNTDEVLENHFPWIRKADVSISFLEPVRIQDLSPEDKKFVGAYCRNIIKENLEKVKSDVVK